MLPDTFKRMTQDQVQVILDTQAYQMIEKRQRAEAAALSAAHLDETRRAIAQTLGSRSSKRSTYILYLNHATRSMLIDKVVHLSRCSTSSWTLSTCGA